MNSQKFRSVLMALALTPLLGLELAALPAGQAAPAAEKGAPFNCPVTHPNGSQPPTKMLSGAAMHGNGELWVSLALDGKMHLRRNDEGEWGAKVPWFRAVHGALTITGKRLDAKARPLHAISSGYGDTGFVATAMYFPTEGCWEVTGKAGSGKLTYVTEVVLEEKQK
jgi:hypothetical protein